jgi:hypothetical protein
MGAEAVIRSFGEIKSVLTNPFENLPSDFRGMNRYQLSWNAVVQAVFRCSTPRFLLLDLRRHRSNYTS